MICQKLISVPHYIVTGGPVVDVCDDCSKYGKEIRPIDIDKFMPHCRLIGVVYQSEE